MTSSSDEEANAAADAMATRFVDSWNRADGVAYGEGYWDDAELVDPTGAIWNGRAAIAQMHVDLWAVQFRNSNVSARVRNVRRLGADHLVVDLDLTLRGATGVPPGAQFDSQRAIRTRLKHLVERRAATWKVVSAQNTFVNCE
jgi:uncharacterized protein (TIGR02246 family)